MMFTETKLIITKYLLVTQALKKEGKREIGL